MEKFFITIGHDGNGQQYEVRDYPHHENDTCKFEILLDGSVVLNLEPDGKFLRTCKNPGGLDEEVIHQIIERVEAYEL